MVEGRTLGEGRESDLRVTVDSCRWSWNQDIFFFFLIYKICAVPWVKDCGMTRKNDCKERWKPTLAIHRDRGDPNMERRAKFTPLQAAENGKGRRFVAPDACSRY